VTDLEQWLAAGFELGNHTFSHPDLHQVSVERYEADVLKGDDIVRPLAEQHAIPYRFFRHPYLHTGRDLETKEAVEGFLARSGYRVAPVTIDNSEWIFARAFDEALDRDETALQQRLGEAYVRYMMQIVAYYESQSRALFDREIPQVLLLHANALNAQHLDRLLAALDQRGYRFVSLTDALDDTAYSSPDTFTGPGGITWLHRWALTRGVDSSFFRGEPSIEPWVEDVAGIED
jgi:peptidoglycan/xylan/chitin deacetylase (PgdA/CDA1 family)